MYFSTYFPLSLWGDVAFFLFWFGWDFVELVDIVAYVFHDIAWTLVKPQWRLFEAFGGGRGRIQSNLVRIQLDVSFRVAFSRICGVSSRIWGVSSRIWGVSSWVWGCWVISMGVLKNFNWGVGHFQWGLSKYPVEILKTVNGGIEKIRGLLCRVIAGIRQGQWRKGQWWHWKGSMGALVRANAGIEKGQWGRWSGSMGVAMGALVRVNGGIEQQWGLNGKIEKDQCNRWWGSIGVLKRGEWGRWSGSMRPLRRVRSERGLGCKLYLAGF